jgi:hypothetical protein
MAIDSRYAEQARAFITETLKQMLPALNVDSGSAINSLLARGGAAINASLLQEIQHMLTSRDFSNPEALSEADVDLLLANLLTERDGGELAYGFVRLYYRDRIARSFVAGTTATTEARDVSFLTLVDLDYLPQDYFLDTTNGLYYLNVPFAAESPGEAYNVNAGEINQLIGDSSGPVLVTNVSAFRKGAEKQTNTEAVRQAQRSVSTRTPLSRDGTIFWMQSLFGSKLRDLLIVGNGDAEMLRDEVYDLGESAVPRFQIGVDSLDPDTRVQLGTAQDLHVGGRTDVYLLFDGINYVQLHADLFADMLLDTDISYPSLITSIQATFVTGTTGDVPSTGKLLIDLGRENEETIYYATVTAVDNDTYIFSNLTPTNPTQIHAVGASVKVVNNGELQVGVDKDITVLPVFQIAEIRILDPITLEAIGDPVPETTAASHDPGWYVTKANRYDLLSAKETKSIILDEKRSLPGNQPRSDSLGGGALDNVVVGTGTYSRYTHAGQDFTGYAGREITLTYGTTTIVRTIVFVQSPTQVVLSGSALGTIASVSFVIEANYAEYIEYPVRVSFYTNTEIAEAQQFLDQDPKRVLCTDSLARMFLPVFLDFTMYYRGDGTSGDVRANINEVLKTSSGQAIGESSGASFEFSDLVNAAYVDGAANYVQTPFQVRVRRLQVDGTWIVQYLNPDAGTVNNLAVKTAPAVTFFTGTGSYDTLNPNRFSATGTPFVLGDVGRRIWINGVGLATITVVDPGLAWVTVDITFTAAATAVNWSFVASFIETQRPSSIEEFAVPGHGQLMLGGYTGNQETVTYLAVAQSGTTYTFVLEEDQGIHFPHDVNEPLRVAVDDYDDDNVITDGVITNERNYRPFLGQVVIEKLT